MSSEMAIRAAGEFGFGFEQSNRTLPLGLAHAYRSLGATFIRYMVQRPTIQSARAEPIDFSFMDQTINNARTAGLDVRLNLYMLNEWMTGGRKLLTGYDSECTRGSRPLSFEEAPQCYDPAIINEIDSDAIEEQAAAVAEHVGGRVDTFGVENEPGVRDYFLTSADDTAQTAIERWYTHIARPFMRGVRSALPHAKFVGQFDAFCDYAHCIEIDAVEHLLSNVGVHSYSDVQIIDRGLRAATLVDDIADHHTRLVQRSSRSYMQDMLDMTWLTTSPQSLIAGRRVMHDLDEVTGEVLRSFDIDATTDAVVAKIKNEFRPRLAQYLQGREMSITEIQHCDPIRLMHETGMSVTEHNPARYVDQHLEWYHRESDGKIDLRIASRSGKWELTEEGKESAQRLGVPRRRRPVETR